MDMTLVHLAEKRFGALSLSEEQFFKDIAQGRPADFSTGVPEQDDPAKAGRWESRCVLAADRIVWLLRDSAALSKIPGSGIRVVGARIEGDIDLQCSAIPFPLAFSQCALFGNVNLVGSSIYLVNFSNSHVCSIDFTASKVDAGILLCDDFRADGRVCLEYATTGGRLDCSGGQFINPMGDALDADGIEVRGDVLLGNGFKAEGLVSLVGANIGGNLECNKGVFKNPNRIALNAERLHVGGDVFLCKGSWGERSAVDAEGFISSGEVRLVGAKIGGSLECQGGLFDSSGSMRPAICARGLRITGDVLFHAGFRAQGTVDLVGARIGGNLECNEGMFEARKGGVALDAERVNVNGDVFLCEGSWGAEGFKAMGEIKLAHSIIGGDLNCMGGRFCHSAEVPGTASALITKCSIHARDLKITGSVLLSEGFSSKGRVDLAGALVGGNLECNSGHFLNKGDVALNVERARVTGDVFLCAGCWRRDKPIENGRFRIDGNLNLIGVAVGGTVKFEGASFANTSASPISSDISLFGATIERELIWESIVSPKQVILDLGMARVGRLRISTDSWLEPGNLRLDGLVYDQLMIEDPPRPHPVKGRVRRDIYANIEWLRLQGNQFNYQPYEQLVAFLRRYGRDNEARTALIAREKDRAKLTHMQFFGGLWHKFLGFSIGYGYRPWRPLRISAVIILLGILIFWRGYKNSIIQPTSPEQPGPKFNALMYSLDKFIPLADLGQEAHWSPTEQAVSVSTTLILLRFYTWLHVIAGWVLAPLVPLGLKQLSKH